MTCRRYPPRPKICPLAAFVLLVTAVAGVAAPTGDVTATRLDGTAIAGKLRKWDNEHVLIATPNGDQHIATDQLISLRLPAAANAPATADKNSGLVELIDGSILPIEKIRVEQTMAVLTLARPATSGDKTLKVPTTLLSAIRFRQLDAALATQWDEMRRLNLANDVLAVLKKDGKSLDYVEGVIGNVSADKIEFKLEGETQHVDRAKIAGVIYYRPDRRTKDEPRSLIQGHSGLRAAPRTSSSKIRSFN